MLLYDLAIFSIMMVLAGCGLIYEYLLSHYAGRVLGSVESAIYAIIGIMIVSMGVGAFTARLIKNPFSGFAWLELIVALLGSSAVLIIALLFAFSTRLPQILSETFALPPDLLLDGGLMQFSEQVAAISPYLMAALLGFLIGMEIPLMARVRQALYSQHLTHNTGSIYGMDYLGAGIGAALWVGLMLTMEISYAAALTASANLIMGLLFLFIFRQHIASRWPLLLAHGLTALLVLSIALFGDQWDAQMEEMLYRDKVVYRLNTHYQRLTITERHIGANQPAVLTFYINGRTQFASNDEHLYHALLTAPTLAASARQERILIIGGGDGLALRDVLRWQPQHVTLLDLDPTLVRLFSAPLIIQGKQVNQRLLAMNHNAFADPRVTVQFGDAFLNVDDLIQQQRRFDSIIVDLPDPSHPDLNKLYSSRFYHKLNLLLAGDGAMVVQSTSPYHARNTFLSIGKTIKHAGFKHVQAYHHNIPSFGEWGWHIASKEGSSAKRRLQQLKQLPIDDGWSSRAALLATFEFGRYFFDDLEQIKINRLGSMQAYQYHQQDWQQEQGVYH
ncbi:MAG: polyamine aminopropyltransferase, partial [Gammaproteobacteria bacterium]|nr:polyamine aminopropyltransferase [Gammaproteobacteria bacterium]